MEYILIFMCSVVVFAIAERQRDKRIFWVLSAASLLMPCLLAAFRAEWIGRDVTHYLIPLMEQAKNANSYSAFLQTSWISSIGTLFTADYEYGFVFLVYAVTKLTGSIFVLQFVIQALVLVPVYIALYRNRQHQPIWLGMLVFYLLFYNASLNLMRQCIAMSILLLSFQMLLEKKWIFTVVFALGALLFHTGAVIVIPVYGICFVIYLLRNVKIGGKKFLISGQMFACVLITAICLVLVFNAQWLAQIASAVGLGQFSGYVTGGRTSFVLRELLLRLPLLLIFIWRWKYFNESPFAVFYLTMLLLDMGLSQLSSVNPYSFRIGLFFSLYTVYSIPGIYGSLKAGKHKTITAIASIFWLVSYWGYLHTVLFLHQTYPYTSTFL